MRIKAMADYLERENKKTVQMCCTCRPICTCCQHIAPHRFMFFFFSFSFSTFILCILVVCCLNALVHSCHCWLRLFIAFPIRSNLPVRKEERNVFFHGINRRQWQAELIIASACCCHWVNGTAKCICSLAQNINSFTSHLYISLRRETEHTHTAKSINNQINTVRRASCEPKNSIRHIAIWNRYKCRCQHRNAATL